MLFEEVSFKASFEGREGRVLEGERKEENSRYVQHRNKRHDHRAVFF